MIKLAEILLLEVAYPFSEPEIEYDEEDGMLLRVTYLFNTSEHKYKVDILGEEIGEFNLTFGLDKGVGRAINTRELTGEGTAMRILKTVAEIVNDFFDRFDSEVNFLRIAGSTEKRTQVYKAVFPKYIDSQYLSKIQLEPE